MGLFRPRRDPAAGPDVWLPLKMALFVTGAAAAMAGIALNRDWLVNVAIGLLLLGFLLRFVGPRPGGPPDGEDPPEP